MTLTTEQVEMALDHLRSEWPGQFMSISEQDDYYDVLTYLCPGELMTALSKLPLGHRPSANQILQTVMDARPGQRPGKPDPDFVRQVIDRARRDLRMRDAG